VDRELLTGSAYLVAPQVVGMHLRRADGLLVRITEVEAYGPHNSSLDPAAHSHRGRRTGNAALFGAAGTWYVYRSYGIHLCLNLVCGAEGVGTGVLLRAAEVVGQTSDDRGVGPGRLGALLGISLAMAGQDALSPAADVRLTPGSAPSRVLSGPRVGVSRAADRHWRFWDADSRAVSRYRRSPRAPSPSD